MHIISIFFTQALTNRSPQCLAGKSWDILQAASGRWELKSFRKRSGEEDPRAKNVLLEGRPSGIVEGFWEKAEDVKDRRKQNESRRVEGRKWERWGSKSE
jgi:hypothetical protein